MTASTMASETPSSLTLHPTDRTSCTQPMLAEAATSAYRSCDIGIDRYGSAFLAGSTNSDDFPVTLDASRTSRRASGTAS